MSKKLEIRIAGEAGTGKTTIAAVLAAVLVDGGFDVALNDPDINIDGLEAALDSLLMKADVLQDTGLEINISTIQVGRPLDLPTGEQTH